MHRSLKTAFLFVTLGGICGCVPDNYTAILQDQTALENEVADAYIQVYDASTAQLFVRRSVAYQDRRKGLKDRFEALGKVLVGAGTTPEKSVDPKSLETLKARLDEAQKRVSTQMERVRKLIPQMTAEDSKEVTAALSKAG